MSTTASAPSALPIVVFSHLRWNVPYQRPEQLLSRVAAEHPVFFIEEPRHEPGCTPRLERLACAAAGVTVLRPVSDSSETGFTQEQMKRIVPLLLKLREEHAWPAVIAWLYTPMAVPALARLRPTLVVYDCIDEFRAGPEAPAELPMFERQLLRVADVVLTARPGLHEAKRRLSFNACCLPSAVDVAADAGEPDAREPLALAAEARPLSRGGSVVPVQTEEVPRSMPRRSAAIVARSPWDSVGDRALDLVRQALQATLPTTPDDMAGQFQWTTEPGRLDARPRRSLGLGS